jgi:dipeptidyl aminopeptidase/acylaminoacyl peptidase
LEQDVLAAVGFLRSQEGVDPDRLGYRGSSLGGFYGLSAAPQARFAAMVLLCPAGEEEVLAATANSEDATADDTQAQVPPAKEPEASGWEALAPPRWDTRGLRSYFKRQDSRLLAAQVRCPVLLVHARGDEIVPFSHSLLLAQHMRTETTLLALEGGTHTTAQHDPVIHRYSVAWLAAKLMH